MLYYEGEDKEKEVKIKNNRYLTFCRVRKEKHNYYQRISCLLIQQVLKSCARNLMTEAPIGWLTRTTSPRLCVDIREQSVWMVHCSFPKWSISHDAVVNCVKISHDKTIQKRYIYADTITLKVIGIVVKRLVCYYRHVCMGRGSKRVKNSECIYIFSLCTEEQRDFVRKF